jgi:hypothetical protein
LRSIESFLADVLALAGEEPDAVRDEIRVSLGELLDGFVLHRAHRCCHRHDLLRHPPCEGASALHEEMNPRHAAPPLRPTLELYTLEELSRSCEDCGQKLVSLFNTRVDVTQWIGWLKQPEKTAGQSGKVVHLKKPH